LKINVRYGREERDAGVIGSVALMLCLSSDCLFFRFSQNATFVNDLLRLYAPQKTQGYLENLLVDLGPRLIVRRVQEMHS